MNKKIFTIIISIIIISIVVTSIIYFVNASKNDLDINEKAEEELKYIGSEIISIMNKIDNISFSNFVLQKKTKNSSDSKDSKKSNEQSQTSNEENSQSSSNKESTNTQINIKYSTNENAILNSNNISIDWEDIKNNSEGLYSIWTTTIIDLHSLNINNEDILNFSRMLDRVNISIKSENKIDALNDLANLYSFIPNYLKNISNNKKKINIENTKLGLLNSLALVEQDNWQEAKNQIQNSINSYTEIINSAEGNEEYSKSKITKIYVLLNELNNTFVQKDKQIYYIKYRNAMEELVNL